MTGTSATLRPRAGGPDWTAPLDDVSPLSLAQALSPLIREINRRSTRGRW
ncbi:hypothetical protein [Streptomyces triticirhizae]|nr:hypothetical protein [Streptomyces triticirhizae]